MNSSCPEKPSYLYYVYHRYFYAMQSSPKDPHRLLFWTLVGSLTAEKADAPNIGAFSLLLYMLFPLLVVLHRYTTLDFLSLCQYEAITVQNYE